MMHTPDHSDHPDHLLVERCKSGDMEAFKVLFERYNNRIYTFIRQTVRDYEEAADLAQETFIRAWSSIRTLKSNEAFTGWLYRIAVNLCRDHFRKSSTSVESLEEMTEQNQGGESILNRLTSLENPEKDLVSQELEKLVNSAIQSLPQEQRMPIILHHLEGMELDEIAKIMGVRPGTVMSRLARGREKLRRKLAWYVEK
jgi:RNA polymerase sigma-70 factor (ECF subfamily)